LPRSRAPAHSANLSARIESKYFHWPPRESAPRWEVPKNKKVSLSRLSPQEKSSLIRMAWEDRTTFEEIRRKTGFVEAEIIKLMRRELKASSFRLWRKRVSGRKTKHEKLFRQSQDGPASSEL